jgi:hypothetical protein
VDDFEENEIFVIADRVYEHVFMQYESADMNVYTSA